MKSELASDFLSDIPDLEVFPRKGISEQIYSCYVNEYLSIQFCNF